MQNLQMSNYSEGSNLSSLANQDEPHEGGNMDAGQTYI